LSWVLDLNPAVLGLQILMEVKPSLLLLNKENCDMVQHGKVEHLYHSLKLMITYGHDVKILSHSIIISKNHLHVSSNQVYQLSAFLC